MEEKQRRSRGLRKEDLDFAHRFAIERLSNENRVFWTRLSALLLGNSFLVVGFASLYGSNNSNDTLLLTIAAAGIFIQAMWPIFALLSYSTNRYLIKLVMDIEDYPYLTRNQLTKKEDIEKRVRRIWTNYAKHFWDTLVWKRIDTETPPKPEPPPNELRQYPAGLIATSVFFVSFLAIWVVAAAIVNNAVAIGLGSVVFAIAILCICVWKRMKNAPIKAVR